MSFIEITDLNFNYKDTNIINNLSLSIAKNDFVSLIGPSGGGKTTLLKILAKVLHNYSGSIYIENIDLKSYNKSFGYMPQNHLLLPWKTVLHNLCVPLYLQGYKTNQAQKIIAPYLEEFEITKLIDRYPNEISGGQKQRVSLLRCLLVQSNILLLDEPFSQLDTITKFKLQKFLRMLYQKYNYTILFITHDIDEALFLSSKVYVMNKTGEIHKTFTIDLPPERNEYTLMDSTFLKIKQQITKLLLVNT